MFASAAAEQPQGYNKYIRNKRICSKLCHFNNSKQMNLSSLNAPKDHDEFMIS